MDNKGQERDVYVNINGRIEYTLAPGQDYPNVRQAKILSLAVSSLEAEGIACTNVGITPITTLKEGMPPTSQVTEVCHARFEACGFIVFNETSYCSTCQVCID